ncbi:MAG: helix-turn-helix domain-containing protein [Chloroflexota bacterium]
MVYLCRFEEEFPVARQGVESGICQTDRRICATISGGSVNQLALLPLESIATNTSAAPGRLVRMPGRGRRTARTAVGAPGFLSVNAAADRLGLKPRSVRYLIEHGRLGSQRLGRMHFVPVSQVEAYRRTRRARARRRQRAAL